MFETGELLIIFTVLLLVMRPADLVRVARILGALHRDLKRLFQQPQQNPLQALLEELIREAEEREKAQQEPKPVNNKPPEIPPEPEPRKENNVS